MITRCVALTALVMTATLLSIIGALSLYSSTILHGFSVFGHHPRIDPSHTLVSEIPFVISKEGYYILDRSLEFSNDTGAAIRIDASNVVLDLNGSSLSCIAQNPSRRNFGVYAQNQENITIRNGNIDGFYMGVWLRDISSNGAYTPQHGWHHLSNLSLRHNTFRGLRVEGNACQVHDNQIGYTGGSKAFKDAYAMGIEIIGSLTSIHDNRVYETFTVDQGEAVGICLGSTWKGVVIRDNIVCNTKAPRYRSIGIWMGVDSSVLVQGNHIHKQTWAIAGNNNDDLVRCQNNFIVECDEARR